MTRRLLSIVQAALIAFLVLLMPAPAPSQEQDRPPAAQQPDKPAEGQKQEGQKQPDTTSDEQPSGTVIMPSETKAEPEPEETTAAPSQTEAKETGDRIYIIKQGDTLWDISNMFLKDPFLWPFIWKANPYITDADLIYPGNKLLIPGLGAIERAMESPSQEELVEKQTGTLGVPVSRKQAKTEPAHEEEVQKSRLIIPEEAPIPIIDKYSLLSAGYVAPDYGEDTIVGGPIGKTVYSFDDIVYVKISSKEDVNIGDKFTMYRPLHRVKTYGRLIKVLGIVEITAKNNASLYTGRITLSFDFAVKGTVKLVPYEEPVLSYEPKEKKNKDISGSIIEVMDTRTVNGQINIVYLDKGSEEGVETGDRFLIYSRQGRLPRRILGETQVILTKEHTATAVIRKSIDTIAKGDAIEYKN